MKRRISYFISAFALSGLFAVVVRHADFSRQQPAEPEKNSAAESAVFSPLSSEVPTSNKPFTAQSGNPTPPAKAASMKAAPVSEVRVRAVRNGRDYGWIQLPRGTRVELLRYEGNTVLIRYDEVTFRVTRAQVNAGVVVPVPRNKARWASL